MPYQGLFVNVLSFRILSKIAHITSSARLEIAVEASCIHWQLWPLDARSARRGASKTDH